MRKESKRMIEFFVGLLLFIIALLVVDFISGIALNQLEVRSVAHQIEKWHKYDLVREYDTDIATFEHFLLGPVNGINYTINRSEKTIFVYGGSSVAGSHEMKGWEDLFPTKLDELTYYTVYNFGQGGATSQRIWQIYQATMNLNPDIIIIYAGHNDYWSTIENTIHHKGFIWNVNQFLFKHSKLYQYIYYVNHLGRTGYVSTYSGMDTEWVDSPAVNEHHQQKHENVVRITEDHKHDIELKEINAINQYKHYIGKLINETTLRGGKVLLITPVSDPYTYETYLSAIDSNKSIKHFKKDHELGVEALENFDEDTLLRLAAKYPENGLVWALLASHYYQIGNGEKQLLYEQKIIEQNYRTHKAKKALQAEILEFEDEINGIHVLDIRPFVYTNLTPSYQHYFDDYVHPTVELNEKLATWMYEKLVAEGLLT